MWKKLKLVQRGGNNYPVGHSHWGGLQYQTQLPFAFLASLNSIGIKPFYPQLVYRRYPHLALLDEAVLGY